LLLLVQPGQLLQPALVSGPGSPPVRGHSTPKSACLVAAAMAERSCTSLAGPPLGHAVDPPEASHSPTSALCHIPHNARR
jgi:hypothetical protein